MLNRTEGITNEIKLVFFWRACSVCKAIDKFINDGLTNTPKITNERFSDRRLV
jgi:hypothetical protein